VSIGNGEPRGGALTIEAPPLHAGGRRYCEFRNGCAICRLWLHPSVARSATVNT
jgi:hypothetical protein